MKSRLLECLRSSKCTDGPALVNGFHMKPTCLLSDLLTTPAQKPQDASLSFPAILGSENLARKSPYDLAALDIKAL